MQSADNAQQSAKPRRGKGRPFVPGDPRIKAGPGRPPKTDALRQLEKMTREQVNEAVQRLLSASVERALLILQKGEDATAWKAAESFIARSIGPVPSAQYIAQANVGQTQVEKIDAAQVSQALATWVAARKLQAPPADVVENGDGR